MTVRAYARGARGYVVEKLQRALKITPDGDYGPKTERAVEDCQAALGHQITGRAGEGFFGEVGVQWPGQFERALQVVASFEGTGFGGVNKRDIDGAGVTLGISGFTTKHGEVQSLVRTFAKLRPKALHKIPSSAKERLLVLVNSEGRNTEAWDSWFYGRDGLVDPWIRDIVASWGQDELFRSLQLQRTEESFWIPARKDAKKLGLTSDQGVALMLDIRVQNGGWRAEHQDHFNAQTHDGTEAGRIRAAVNAVVAKCKPRWAEDVRTRKEVFLRGHGEVHGRKYHLEDYAFLPF